MTFRARLLLAFALATLVPLTLLAVGVRRQLSDRLVRQYERRVERQAQVAEQDLARQSAEIASRLATLAATASGDNRLRLAVLRGPAGDRGYLLDWATQAMRLTGLTMLQLQDEEGRIVSSGHFRNEFDRVEPEIPRVVGSASGPVLVRVRAPEGPFLGLARTDSVRIGDRRFDLTGGVRVDSQFLARFAREEGLAITLVTPSDTLIAHAVIPSGDVLAELELPFVVTGDSAHLTPARLAIAYTIPELDMLRRDVDRWFLGAMSLVLVAALALATWLSARVSGPLTSL
ncbi:MAG TPA: hypothetical protein VLE53_11130, partial [Gemmatimonadaceae bacterium]|nr:hypothetical protein [Gemmatimonadaceae bacterium]